MELFCQCNSYWEVYHCPDIAKKHIQVNYAKDGNPYDGYCKRCRYYKWYDADYENMMFDLKNMNQQ